MAGKNTAAFAIFPTRSAAESAVDRLVAAGFSNQDVSVLMSDTDNSREFATEKNTTAPEGTTTGVSVGGVIGGTLGLLAGIGALAIPGVGPLIAAGPIMGALAGLGVGDRVGGAGRAGQPRGRGGRVVHHHACAGQPAAAHGGQV